MNAWMHDLSTSMAASISTPKINIYIYLSLYIYVYIYTYCFVCYSNLKKCASRFIGFASGRLEGLQTWSAIGVQLGSGSLKNRCDEFTKEILTQWMHAQMDDLSTSTASSIPKPKRTTTIPCSLYRELFPLGGGGGGGGVEYQRKIISTYIYI